jgi:formyl-CoA transferase
MSAALEDVLVVDFAQLEAGSSATQMLAWLGATVVKVEAPGRGEAARTLGATRPGEDSYLFLVMNANKKSITLDLKHPKGQETIRRLLAKADVVVENYRPGVIDALGLDYARVREVNPRIVYARIRGFGADGPNRDLPAFDPVAQATGGIMSVNGDPDGPPQRPALTIGDSAAAFHCLVGVLGALYQRGRTGEGQLVEIAMQDSAIGFARTNFALHYMLGGRVPRMGNEGFQAFFGLGNAVANAYPCKPGGPDDWCFISFSPANGDFAPLFRAIGRAELADDPRFANAKAREQNRPALDEILTAWSRARSKFEVMDILGRGGVPAGAVATTGDLINDPYLNACGTMATMAHPVRGPVVLPGFPVRMSASRVAVAASPLLGEHTDEILRSLLGMSDEAIAALRNERVV